MKKVKKPKKKQKSTGGGRRLLDKNAKDRGIKLGHLIQTARVAKKLKQEDLASKSGVRINTLKSIESGRVFSPSIFTIVDLAKALDEKDINKWLK